MTESTQQNPKPNEPVQLPSSGSSTTAAPSPEKKDDKKAVSLQEGRLFEFYRAEEGQRARAVIGLALATLALYGAHAFHDWLPENWHRALPGIGTVLDDSGQFALSGALLSAGAIAVASLVGIYKLINYPKFVDFLIDTENELKKVSWASKRQVVTESIVVVFCVVLVGAYIFAIDSILIMLKKLPWDNFWSRIF